MTKHMKPFTKSTLFSFMLCLAVLLAGVVTYLLRLSPNEKENDAISVPCINEFFFKFLFLIVLYFSSHLQVFFQFEQDVLRVHH